MHRLIARLRSRAGALVHDLCMIPVAWLGAYWLRFNLESIPAAYFHRALETLPMVVVVQGVVFWYMGLYRGVWRFASIPDLVRILRAVFLGMVLAAVTIFITSRMYGVPRSVPPLAGLLLVALLGGARLVYRWFKDHRLLVPEGARVLIVGAGRAGEMLSRDLMHDRASGCVPVGFVDDDRAKRGREVRGLRVLGDCDALPRLVQSLRIDRVIIAVPSATAAQMRRLIESCERTGVPYHTLPRMEDLVRGRISLEQVREVSIEDLLGREPVALDWGAIEAGVRGRVVLVSGGGGSIGGELCRQIARLEPAALVVVDHGEYNLYRVDMELRRQFPALALQISLCDVCDAEAMGRVFASARPDWVFHAAAYKHVPMLEAQARAAVRANVLGTRTIGEAAARHGAGCFVLVSTDKAVNPANVMGASKRVAEMVCADLQRVHPGTRFVTVRFGNVLGSAGSVVPLFRRQIAAGGPVTVTHPEVKRYFMTIPEACQLILQAAVMGEGGEIFVLDMGEPVKISYLAEMLIRLSGKRPGEDVEISYVGLRPGEKLFEELFHDQESLRATAHRKILLARVREPDRRALESAIAELGPNCERLGEEDLRVWLHALVPEYAGARPVATVANVVAIDAKKR